MPGGDGTGPGGQGPGTGWGRGGCRKGKGRSGDFNQGRKGKGVNNHSFTTRVQPDSNQSTLKALVDKEKCIACSVCVDICPQQAITVDNVAVVAIEKCTGCGACAAQCPVDAISMV